MRVLMINTERNRGGAAAMAATLVQVMNQQFDDVTTSLIHSGDSIVNDDYIGIKRPGLGHLLALQTRLLGSHRLHDFGVAKRIIPAAQQADVVHFHNLHGYYLDYVQLVEALADKPIVWTWHDMWAATGRCGFSGECDRWQNGCAPCPDKKRYPSAWFDFSGEEYVEKFALFSKLKNLQIVCPSKWLADIAVRRGFKPDQVAVVPNPVDTDTFRPRSVAVARQRLDLPENEPISLFIAADCNDPRKGYVDFCEATRDTDGIAVAVGKPPPKPAKHVVHVGSITDRERLAEYYVAADVMIIPSYADNFPNTVVESLVCGTPVIGYDEGGIPSQLIDQHSQIVPKGKIEVLRSTLLTYFENLTQARNGAAELAESSKLRWSRSTIAEAYLEKYKRAADRAESILS